MKKKRTSITQQIYLEAKPHFDKYSHNNTRQQYLNNLKRFIHYCRESHNCKTIDECNLHIQDYSDYLQEKQLSASTIHSYLAPVCLCAGVNMKTISKPIRHTSCYIRGRENNSVNKSSDLDDIRWSHLVEFQKRVGLRRAELVKITGKSLVRDESKNWCISVIGKGGKKQLQLIKNEDVKFIKKYFDNIGPDERIFQSQLFENKLNLHFLRAECAKQFYKYTLERLRTDPTYQDILIKQIKNRWNKYNLRPDGTPKPFDNRRITGYYYLRGANRKAAQEIGASIKFNKLALLATSIFKLAHWRLDVTVNNYLSINNGGQII